MDVAISEQTVNDMRRNCEAFRDAGLLWWVNRILHTFGWQITFVYGSDKFNREYIFAVPTRTDNLGFDGDTDRVSLRQFRHTCSTLKPAKESKNACSDT